MSRDAGMLSEMVRLQDEENRINASLTPEEKGQRAKEQLRAMAEVEPGLRYLFPDTEPEDG